MTEEAVARVEEPPLFSWHFLTLRSLQEDGLEEYTLFLDDHRVSRYGDLLGGGELNAKLYQCAVRKRAEIDWCMAILRVQYPQLWRLLDRYYLTGVSAEYAGWYLAAVSLGRKVRRDNLWDRDAFEHEVDQAVEYLWQVHVKRWGRWA